MDYYLYQNYTQCTVICKLFTSLLVTQLMGIIKFLTVINPINKAFDILSITAILFNLYPALHLHITVIVTS